MGEDRAADSDEPAGLQAAEQSIAAKRSAAMENVGTIASDTASAIVERLIGKAPTRDELAAAMGDALKR